MIRAEKNNIIRSLSEEEEVSFRVRLLAGWVRGHVGICNEIEYIVTTHVHTSVSI